MASVSFDLASRGTHRPFRWTPSIKFHAFDEGVTPPETMLGHF
jgi:hypothetical protein